MDKPLYPKMVYGPGSAQVVINGPDEMPEGYMTFEEKHRPSGAMSAAVADAAVGAVINGSSQKAADDAQEARDAATKATQVADEAKAALADENRAHRERLKTFLTEHNVEFKPQIGLAKLEDLAGQLTEHLAKKADDDAAAAAGAGTPSDVNDDTGE